MAQRLIPVRQTPIVLKTATLDSKYGSRYCFCSSCTLDPDDMITTSAFDWDFPAISTVQARGSRLVLFEPETIVTPSGERAAPQQNRAAGAYGLFQAGPGNVPEDPTPKVTGGAWPKAANRQASVERSAETDDGTPRNHFRP
ncbi:uncharacterized protein BO96DRAFT_353295 [Aspergillus niger CBS 101883]|uniref:uncharacterized protein n=1 Tax=Aspergillus lacticoffeatus (strain CBS 101883) TaxID=1450533 RepID=UPI000D7EC41B|nr:uncharacterized protein BO96DRAFT_353295 [Aspergillus niger CBS 101883]PYH50113.1 hypothetical protein BO96DRAFT_353295 [Aspergillus niger CBS 101883]